jgi:hypothetical protein
VSRETHGRWPWVAAAALGPVTALAVRRPGLRPWAALLWHQTEEWVWPGGFLPWLNHEIIGSEEDEFPLDRRTGFVVNVAFGWGTSIAATAGPRAAVPAAVLYTSHLGNVALHVPWAVRHRRYDPGVVTAVATLLPTAAIGLRDLARDEAVDRRSLALGAAIGIGSAALLPIVLRRRLRSRSA